jgi:hypothetical protein
MRLRAERNLFWPNMSSDSEKGSHLFKGHESIKKVQFQAQENIRKANRSFMDSGPEYTATPQTDIGGVPSRS